MNNDCDYNLEEVTNFANMLAQEEKKTILLSGKNIEEAEKKAQQKFNEVSRRHAIEYLKNIDEKLDSLSNQTVANLLKALIAMGLSIEDDEELEYWINLLTQQTLDRIAMYFNQRDSASLWKQITSRPRKINILHQLKNYSTKEIEALSEMIQSLDKIIIAKTKNINIAQKRSDILKKINKTLKNDLKIKNQENQRLHRQYRNRNKPTEEKSEDPSDVLKNKMTAEGVEVNGRYWNYVISNFEASANKTEFAKHWTIDNELHYDLDVQKENEAKTQEEEYNKIKEAEQQEIEQQEIEQQRQRQETKQRQEREVQQKEIEQTQQPDKAQQETQRDDYYAEMIKIKRGIKEDKNTSKQDEGKSKYTQKSKSNSYTNQGAAMANQKGGR